MPTHPLWRRFELADLGEVRRLRVGTPPPRPVVVVPSDDSWPHVYGAVAELVRGALGDRVLTLDHIGSTSVPGLAAKPILDINLAVADSADEASYVPALEAVGFYLRVREPEWEEHRMLALAAPDTNLHVFSLGSPELARTRMFRDWLRTHPDDREAYGALKTRLASEHDFAEAMDYNNHKAGFVYDLYEKIFAADPEHEHEPRLRSGA